MISWEDAAGNPESADDVAKREKLERARRARESANLAREANRILRGIHGDIQAFRKAMKKGRKLGTRLMSAERTTDDEGGEFGSRFWRTPPPITRRNYLSLDLPDTSGTVYLNADIGWSLSVKAIGNERFTCRFSGRQEASLYSTDPIRGLPVDQIAEVQFIVAHEGFVREQVRKALANYLVSRRVGLPE